MVNKVWKGRPNRIIPLGRPRMRWIEKVTKELRKVGGDLKVAED